jgi:hypothetical protein
MTTPPLEQTSDLARRLVWDTVRSRSFSAWRVLDRVQEMQLTDAVARALDTERRAYIATREALDAVREYVADCDDMLGLGVENIIERHEEATA